MIRRAANGLMDLWARTSDTRFGEEHAGELRAERLEYVTRNTAILQPFAIAILIVIMGGFVGHGVDGILFAWTAAVIVIGTGFRVWTAKAVRRGRDVTQHITTRGIVMSTVLCSPIWVLVPVLTGTDAVLLGAVAATILAVGPVTVYPVPRACVIGSVGCTVGVAGPYAVIGWGIMHEPVYGALAGLMVVQGTVMCLVWIRVTALSTDRFGDRVEIARQKMLNAVLLQEFEDGSEAALWETDANGKVTRRPAIIEEIVGNATRSDADLMALADHAYDKPHTTSRIHLIMAEQRPFRDETLRLVDNGGRSRWLSFRGRPILTASGEVDGWRGMVTDVTDSKRAERRMRYLADNDVLTGLANRTAFNKRIDDWVGNDVRHAAVHLDLDKFKLVNDTLGHAAGDALLREAARRMTHVVDAFHDDCVVARIGGDEFMVGVASADDGETTRMVDALIASLSSPFDLDEGTMSVGASAGIAVWPDDGEADQIPNRVDLALYRAKESGRGRWCRYEDGMDRRARDRKRLEVDMRQAVTRNELHLVYQPVVDLETGRTSGVETLVRWNHPTFGAVSPADFIPIAEDSGAVVEIGAWVMRTACVEAVRWRDPIRVAVNVSARQVAEGAFVGMVSDVLRESGLDPSRLEIELTETALVHDAERAFDVMERLRALGCRVVLDDFGTGYSCLSYLRKFSFDKIKIDIEFVRELGRPSDDGKPGADTIVSLIVNFANALGMETTAEGVETANQADILRGMGCTYGQGWAFSRPVPAADLVEMLGMKPRPVPHGMATAMAG